MPLRILDRFIPLCCFAVITQISGISRAQLMEPDGFGPIPIDPRTLCNNTNNTGGTIGCTGSANLGDFQEATLANNLDNMSLLGIFKYYESDNSGKLLVDYLMDAKTEPSTFNPLCSISAKMLMRGSGCFVDFGWYCADGTPSPAIHPLITAQQIYDYAKMASPPYPKVWQNNDGAFLPKTGYELAGTPLSNVANDPNFQACSTKKIGFAVKGNTTVQCGTTAGCACAQNKYTEQTLNQVNTATGQSYIDAIVYTSKNNPGRFYVAIEDLPTSADKFAAPYCHKNSAGTCDYWTADGDFNDFVVEVDGVMCPGGAQLCTVPGQLGMCTIGVTGCVDSNSAATPSCNGVFQPKIEACNGVDDDCNGTIDDGSNLCPIGQICHGGSCVHPCATTGEFVCPAGQTCAAAGYCVDNACASLNCAADQRCVSGQCASGCDGVVCTAGQQCISGACVDLCAVRKQAGLAACPDNFVCQSGACVPNCTCMPCPDSSLSCDAVATSPTYGQCHPIACSGSNCTTGGAPGAGGSATAGGSKPIGGSSSPGGTIAALGGASILGGATSTQGGASANGGNLGSGGSTCEAGHETCGCYGNDTCNAGLTCASHLCVNLGSRGVAAIGGNLNAGGSSGLVGSAAAGNSSQSEVSVKSGCGCRATSNGYGGVALTYAAVSVLALARRRRRAALVHKGPRQ